MDTLATSVSTFKIPNIHPKSHHFNHHLPQQQQSHLITTKPTKSSTKSSNKTHHHLIPQLFLNPSSQTTTTTTKQPLNPKSHHKASTGYAVALLDIARRHNALELIERDVRRLSKWVSNGQIRTLIANPNLGDKEKGEILREVVEKGEFRKCVCKLVSLLVEKNVELVSEVLIEFGRIYDEVSGNREQVVLISSGVKMEKNQILGVAKQIQKISGAVKVTVRQVATS